MQIKAHDQVMALVALDRPLTEDEKWFVLENFHEGAMHINSKAGAFFTPSGLARDFSLHVTGPRIIDLCAGIGSLAFACRDRASELVCVEINPDYARIGKKVVPEAN